MDDMISRQAVINEMKDMYTAAKEWAEGAHEDDTRARAESCMATNVELKLRVEKLPSVQPQSKREWYQKGYEAGQKSAQPRWIPVTEALPEDGLYLVTTSKGQVQAHVFSHNGNSEEYWMRCNRAWMPLPEPYEPQESEVKK